ncbi:MAG: PIN domain-containing protein [Bacilli bacterium]|nr:PIN domain-containing protein [Bacilli bacterium]
MRILVDTNIFLDFFLPNAEFQGLAKDLFLYCRRSRSQIYVSATTLRDVGYIAKRRLHDEEKGRYIQREVYSICTKIVSVSADAAITALYDGNPDYEDSLIMEAAEEAGCDCIVTRNAAHFANSPVPAFDIRDFLDYVHAA